MQAVFKSQGHFRFIQTFSVLSFAFSCIVIFSILSASLTATDY